MHPSKNSPVFDRRQRTSKLRFYLRLEKWFSRSGEIATDWAMPFESESMPFGLCLFFTISGVLERLVES